MSVQKSRLEFLDEPETMELEEVISQNMTPFLVTGIVNPFGPTLNTVVALGTFKAGGMLSVVHMMLNPFQQKVEKIAELVLDTKLDSTAIISSLFGLNYGSCPTLILLGSRVPEEKVVSVMADFIGTFSDNRGVLERVKEFHGNPWDRVSKEIAQPLEGLKKPKSFLGKLFGKDKKPTSLNSAELEELAELLVVDEHVAPEIKALFYSWGGAIKHMAPGMATLLEDKFRDIFFRLASNTHLPGAETPQATSQSASIKLKELNEGQLIQLLDYPEDYETLSDGDLDLFVHSIIFFYGLVKNAELRSKISPLYELFCQRIPETQRLKNYCAMRENVIKNKIDLMALMPYLCEDDDLGMVSTAALDYAVIYTPDNNDLLTGPKIILAMMTVPVVKNPAAALGGLVMLGDQRVMDLIRSTREHLDEEQVSILTKCQSGFIHAATVEFYLTWLEDLKGDYNDAIFGLVASALHNMVKNPSVPFVTSIERIFPAPFDANPIRLLQKWSIPQYAKTLLPRFQAIAKREKDPKVMHVVMRAWGL